MLAGMVVVVDVVCMVLVGIVVELMEDVEVW